MGEEKETGSFLIKYSNHEEQNNSQLFMLPRLAPSGSFIVNNNDM
jgi:hypothetical protein